VPTGMAHTHPHHTHHTVTPVRGELPSADLPWLLACSALQARLRVRPRSHAWRVDGVRLRPEPRACHSVRRNGRATGRPPQPAHGKPRDSRKNRTLHSAHRHQMLTRVKGILDFCSPTIRAKLLASSSARPGPVFGFPCQIWPKLAGQVLRLAAAVSM
jgi:hypothetical protein